MYLQKPSLLPFTSQTNFSSKWTLAFLTSFLHMQAISLFSFQVAGLHFHLLYASFLCLSSLRSCTFIHTGLLPQLLNCLNIVMDFSCALRQLPLKISQLFWGLCSPGQFPTDPAKQVPEICSSEVHSVLCLARSSQDLKLHSLMLTAAKAALGLYTIQHCLLVWD